MCAVLSSVSLAWEVLNSVLLTAIVTHGRASLAVQIACAEKPVLTATPIPIVAQMKFAVMAATACRFVLGLHGLGEV